MNDVIDVVPLGSGEWLARCECGATERFPDAPSGWAWVLAHPCPEPTDGASVLDLTEPEAPRCDSRRHRD